MLRPRTLTLDRAIAPIVGAGIPAGFLFSMAGLGDGPASGWTFLPLAITLAVLAVAMVGAHRGSRRAGMAEWEAPATATAGAQPQRRGRVATHLALVEARELLLSPWFALAIGFSVLLLLGVTSFESSWWTSAMLLTLLVHPLCGFTIVAVHRNVTRARRDETSDLIASCPATDGDRLRGHLLAATVPIAVGAAFVTLLLVGSAAILDIYGPVDDRVLSEAVLAAAILPGGAAALGVLLGRRAPFALAPVVALGAILLVDLEFWGEPDGRGWLATGFPSLPVDAVYLDPPHLGRLAWFTGLALVVAALALARSRLTRFALRSGALLAVAGVALAAVGPSASTAQTLAGYAMSTPGHNTCIDLSDHAVLCVPPPYADRGHRLAEELTPIAAAIPPDPNGEPVLLGFGVADPGRLQRDVRRLVGSSRSVDVVLPFGHHKIHRRQARFELAAFAIDIPRGDERPRPLLLDGQARGVVMLWLVAAGLPSDDGLRLLDRNRNAPSSPREAIWPAYCTGEVQWAPQDLEAARTIVGLPRSTTAAIVEARWEEWTDPATPTDELLIALGLDPLGAPAALEPVGDWC